MISSLAKARKAVGTGYGDVGERLVGFSATEVYGPLANGWKRLGRSMRVLGDLQAALATAELVTLGDALNYQAANAKSAKVRCSLSNFRAGLMLVDGRKR